MSCFECICNTCANNEERFDKRPDEAQFFCYNCDECNNYTGNFTEHRSKWKNNCEKYKISEHEIERRRRTIKIARK